MRSLILFFGSAVLSVLCVSDLIPGTGQTRHHCDPLTVAPLAATGLVATLNPRIPRNAAVRTTKYASLSETLSSASLRVMWGEIRRHSDSANGLKLNRSGEWRVSIWRPPETTAQFHGAQQGSYGFDSATLANATIVAILLDCGWGRKTLA